MILVLSGQHRGNQIHQGQSFEPSIPAYDILFEAEPDNWEMLYSRVGAQRIEATLRNEATVRRVSIMPVIAERYEMASEGMPALDEYGDPKPLHRMFVDVLGGEIHGPSQDAPCPHSSYFKDGTPGVHRCTTPNDPVAVPCVYAWFGNYYQPPATPIEPSAMVLTELELASFSNA